jgi:hypothetical protein
MKGKNGPGMVVRLMESLKSRMDDMDRKMDIMLKLMEETHVKRSR